MPVIQSGDADIVYETVGSGAPVVLLHPFPVHHAFWMPAAQALLTRYRLILPDLRGHGDSGVGEGPATMAKHAEDIDRVLKHAEVERALFAGVSIGGYALFEFWRKFRDRVAALALVNTKASADTPDARSARLQAAAEVLERGTEPFIQSMLPKVLSKTTHNTRPDLVAGAADMMRKMSAEDVSLVQQGMAERPDSVATLKTISVPTLIITGDEDSMTGPPEAAAMQKEIAGSQMKVIARAGHYSPWEQPEEAGRLLRQFFDSV